jgi:hypothetical protein
MCLVVVVVEKTQMKIFELASLSTLLIMSNSFLLFSLSLVVFLCVVLLLQILAHQQNNSVGILEIR